jgi:hypothetical protein
MVHGLCETASFAASELAQSWTLRLPLHLKPINGRIHISEYTYLATTVANNIVKKGIEHVNPCQQGNAKANSDQVCSIFTGSKHL